MVTCSQCATESADGQPACPECGTALDAAQAPAGTWESEGAEDPEAEAPPPDGSLDGPPSSPPVLTVHEGGGTVETGTGPGGPLVGLALAVADDTIPDAHPAADSTGTRPIVPWRDSEPGGATVVPLRPEMIRRPPTTAETAAAAPAEGAEAQRAPADPLAVPVETRSDTAARQEPPANVKADAPPAPPAEPPARITPAPPGPPPVLASRLLREDLTPTEPGRVTLRLLAIGIGAGGAAAALGLAGTSAATLAVAGALLACALLGVLPVSYATRAFGVLAASGLGLVTGGWMGLDAGGSPVVAALALCTTTLAGGLFFRATYRAAHMGRVLTGIGVLLGGAWLATTWTYELTSLDVAWQSWLPAVLQVGFLFLLLLCLLAFMDASTTAGCRAWGVLVLLWLAIRVPVAFAVRAWPLGSTAEPTRGLLSTALTTGSPLGPPSPEVWAVGIGQVALVILAAISLAHVLAVAASRAPARPR